MRIKKEEILNKINALLAREKDLSSYELRAVKDFAAKVSRKGKYLTPGQKSFLLKIESGLEAQKTIQYSKEESSLITRLENLQKEQLSPWEQGFIPSLLAQAKRQRMLSEKQISLLAKVESNYSKAAKQEKSDWENNFSDEKKRNFRICTDYYRTGMYYRDLVKKVIADPNYIPTQKEYKAICENKFAKRIVESFASEPKFKKGQLVRLSGPHFDNLRLTKEKLTSKSFVFVVTVVEATTPEQTYLSFDDIGKFDCSCVSAAKGCRLYELTCLNHPEVGKIVVEERFILKTRRTK